MPCIPKSKDEETRISQGITKGLKDEAKKYDSVIRLLLLGTGESGKTTIIKQMKLIHINGFSDVEKRDKIPSIKQNIHESIYTLVSSMDQISPPVALQREGSKESAAYILQLGSQEPNEYSDQYFDHVKTLWADPGIKQTFKRSNEFQLIDSASHFLDRLDEIRQPDYIPTVQDMLFCRIMTVAISQIEFSIKHHGNKVDFCMYDVGGQRGQRKKWISVFEGIRAILFLIAASDFDQTLREDGKTNRLKEGFKVFSDIFWSRFVRKSGKIVFLNKQDLLKQKIEDGHKLENYFPEFKDYKVTAKGANPNDEYDRAKFFMRDMIFYIAQNKPVAEKIDIIPGALQVSLQPPDQAVYTHFTTATDTDNVKRVFDTVKHIILTENIQNAGIA